MERQPGRSAAVAQFGRAGRLGASQSFGLRRQASWLKVWRGGGCNFSATERAHRSEEHTSEIQSLRHLVCRLLLETKRKPYGPLKNQVAAMWLHGHRTLPTAP